MGWETGVSLASSALQSFGTTQTAKAQSKAIAQTAENQATNMANQTSRNIGALETSFLKGGIALTGEGGPAAFFQQAGQQGTIDIDRTIANANASINDTMNAARTKSLDGIAGAWGKIPASSMDTAISSAWQGSWLQSAWNGITGNPDPSPMGPNQTQLPWQQPGWSS